VAKIRQNASRSGRRAQLEAEMAEIIASLKKIKEDIATAREHGDLRENAEYAEARERDRNAYKRLNAIRDEIDALGQEAPPTGEELALDGVIVAYNDLDRKITNIVQFSIDDSDPSQCIVNVRSPLGQALTKAMRDLRVDTLPRGTEVKFRPVLSLTDDIAAAQEDPRAYMVRTVMVLDAVRPARVRENPVIDEVVQVHARELRRSMRPRQLLEFRRELEKLAYGAGSPQLAVRYRSFSHDNLVRLIYLLTDAG